MDLHRLAVGIFRNAISFASERARFRNFRELSKA
ncbi:hypothetical protein NK6_537 [Bradyrhizobium diazoefficiens]|uniref:Uncharacterized protein n=1 Tax=Bradyrhizobium diazoefficiens TaxID=1355477 RepID=A0A0E4FQN6_9BRAD|nr:hypothetical protein NK6_537 [Bradyrhizobium diazoefficiens]